MKQLLTISAVVISMSAGAQVIPNADLENWTIDSGTEDPADWATLNVFELVSGTAPVTKVTDAHSGDYAARIETLAFDTDNDGENDTIAGLMFLGELDVFNNIQKNGIPCTQRPDSITAWYKYAPVNNDQCVFRAIVSKWDAANHARIILAQGEFYGSEPQSSYKRLSVGLDYSSTETPDTLYIVFLSSYLDASPGSVLWVDDLSAVSVSTAGIPEATVQEPLLYPNPADRSAQFVTGRTETVHLYNPLGEEVATISAGAFVPLTIPTKELESGVYLLRTDSGMTKRLTVRH